VAAKPQGFGRDGRRKEMTMQEQRGTRRWLLGVLATAAALGSGHRTRAADDDPRPRPDYGSKAAFKLECELLGGTFTESLGYTYCHSCVGTVQCDGNGNNCTFTPTSDRPRPLPDGVNHYDGSFDQVAPGDDSSVAAPADDHEPKTKAKHGKGKKHRRGGKKRK
jgi:hypothetical protein